MNSAEPYMMIASGNRAMIETALHDDTKQIACNALSLVIVCTSLDGLF